MNMKKEQMKNSYSSLPDRNWNVNKK